MKQLKGQGRPGGVFLCGSVLAWLLLNPAGQITNQFSLEGPRNEETVGTVVSETPHPGSLQYVMRAHLRVNVKVEECGYQLPSKASSSDTEGIGIMSTNLFLSSDFRE